MAMLEVSLEKSSDALILCLEKAGLTTVPEVELGFGLDVSGSFEDEHEDGTTNQLLTRLVPWGLVFDPDKKLDVHTFSDGPSHVVDVGPVDATNYKDFVRRNIIRKVNGWNGGTDYSYLIEQMLRMFGWLATEPKSSFFGRLLGRKPALTQGQKRRSLSIIVTDGDNSDKARTLQVLADSEARGDEVYFLFVGISNQGARFPFLESLGERFKNTGFVPIHNLRAFVALSDDELNEALISDELLAWLKS